MLKSQVVLVAGGSGGVGEGIVRILLKANATVIVPSRNEIKLERLQEYCEDVSGGRLHTQLVNISEEGEAFQFQRQLKNKYGQLDMLVASLGGWWQGQSIIDLDLPTWNRMLKNNLTSHFLAVRAFVPLLKPQTGVYVHINGYSADQAYPTAGPVAMAAAAQKSMVLTLSDELADQRLRVYELILGPIMTRNRLKHGQGEDSWYYPEDVGQYIFDLYCKQNDKYQDTIHYLLEKETA